MLMELAVPVDWIVPLRFNVPELTCSDMFWLEETVTLLLTATSPAVDCIETGTPVTFKVVVEEPLDLANVMLLPWNPTNPEAAEMVAEPLSGSVTVRALAPPDAVNPMLEAPVIEDDAPSVNP